MQETCLQHEGLARNTAMIPKMHDDLTEIKEALLGTFEKAGIRGRLEALENERAHKRDVDKIGVRIDEVKKDVATIMRVAWGLLGIVTLLLLTYGGFLLTK